METQGQHNNTTAVNHPSDVPRSQDVDSDCGSESEQKLRTEIKTKAQLGDYSAAIALINQLLAIHPESATDYNNRGLMYFSSGQLVKALQDYNQSIKLNPKLDQAYNNRGNCYAAQGNWAEALRDYETALDLNPTNLKTWINQGIIFRDMGLYDLALEDFDLALVIGQKFQGRIYAERGYTYHLRGDWNCAIADYNQALSILPLTAKLKAYREKVETWLRQLLHGSVMI